MLTKQFNLFILNELFEPLCCLWLQERTSEKKKKGWRTDVTDSIEYRSDDVTKN